jgi:hypothetical protein
MRYPKLNIILTEQNSFYTFRPRQTYLIHRRSLPLGTFLTLPGRVQDRLSHPNSTQGIHSVVCQNMTRRLYPSHWHDNQCNLKTTKSVIASISYSLLTNKVEL